MAGDLRDLHDRLLAERPNGARHDESACPFCLTAGTEQTSACECGSTGAAAQVAALNAENSALRTENAELQRQVGESLLAASRAADQIAAAAEQAELERRMSARATAAIGVGFPAGAVADHLPRWAKMSDDEFDRVLEDLAVIGPTTPDSTIPAFTALHAGRDTVPTSAGPVKELMALRQNGQRIDFNQLR
jgi:hypothetical protein